MKRHLVSEILSPYRQHSQRTADQAARSNRHTGNKGAVVENLKAQVGTVVVGSVKVEVEVCKIESGGRDSLEESVNAPALFLKIDTVASCVVGVAWRTEIALRCQRIVVDRGFCCTIVSVVNSIHHNCRRVSGASIAQCQEA